MFGRSWRVARIAGVEVRVDSSWAVIALLITYSMYLRLSVLYPELEGGAVVGTEQTMNAEDRPAPLAGSHHTDISEQLGKARSRESWEGDSLTCFGRW